MMPDPTLSSCCYVVVVAASAGGVEALIDLMGGLPGNLPAAVFLLLHIPETGPSMLPHILGRRGALPVAAAQDGEVVAPGHVYVAGPGRHLVLEPGRMRLVAGPRENGHRPSADVLFRTAAAAYGSRVAGVVLSGADADGAAGLTAIKGAGGTALVQDPEEALHPRMPRSALDVVSADYCLPVRKLAQQLTALARTQSDAGTGRAEEPLKTEGSATQEALA